MTRRTHLHRGDWTGPRLSPKGRLRHAILAGLGLSMTSLLAPQASLAAQFGSPGWFAAQGAAAPGGVAPAPQAGPMLPPSVTTPAVAMQRAQRSIDNLNRAAAAVVAAQSVQSAARQLSLQAISTVPDGLAPGGLHVGANAAADAANPQGCAASNTCTWLNADLPTQTNAADGKTTVTVKQTASKAILTWDSFNVGKNTTLEFDQHSGTQSDGTNDWIALNRVSAGASPSQILGTLKADGSVYLINQNGIIFGGSSKVNVHSLLVSSLPLYLPGTASTLTPGDDEDYLARSNRLFLETGITSYGLGTASGSILGLGNSQRVALSTLGELPGDIEIEAGASISTDSLGYSLIAAPNVINAGHISAKDGQIVLAAGVGVTLRSPQQGELLLQPLLTGVIDDDIAGGDATPVSRLENSGLVESVRGDIRMLGTSITQAGVLVATTSVTRAGSIDLLAMDEQVTDSANSRNGVVVLAPDSVTAVLPDANNETTLSSPAADSLFRPGSVSLKGGAVRVDGGALIEAPGQSVRIVAVGSTPTNVFAGIEGYVSGRVYIDEGAVIDVAGVAGYELPMSANLVNVPRIGQNELADTPVQRGGPVFGVPVTVDIRVSGTRSDGVAWTGTPLANVGGYIQQVPRKVQQLLQNGGTVSLAGDEVLARAGSQLNLDGGFIHYLGGVLETTRLIAANGAIIDIGSADPNVIYAAVAGRFTANQPRWNTKTVYVNPLLGSEGGVYEAEYIQGGNAGTLNVYAEHMLALDGDISGRAQAGRRQVASGKLPAQGSLYVGPGNGLRAAVFPDQSALGFSPDYRLQDTAPDITVLDPHFSASTAVPDAIRDEQLILLSTRDIESAGFGSLTVVADGDIELAAGEGLVVAPGGSVSLTGGRVTVASDISARAGSINITTAVARGGSGDIVVKSGVTLDASGFWVNDAGLSAEELSGGALVNGGNIVLRTLQASGVSTVCVGSTTCTVDYTGSIILEQGSLLDVSSGGRVLPSGKILAVDGIPQGRGGSVSLLTYDASKGQFGDGRLPLPGSLPNNGRIVLGGEIRSWGFSGGGTFTARALGISIGSKTQNRYQTLRFEPEWFDGQGFGAYVLSALYDARVGTDAVVRPVQSNLVPVYDTLLRAPTGTDIHAHDADHPDGIYTTVGRLDDYHRQATDFSLFAGDYLNWRVSPGVLPDYSRSAVRGLVEMLAGSKLLADPRAKVVIGSNNRINIQGEIVAHGGSITITGDTGSGGYAQNPGTIINGGAFSDIRKEIWLGAESLLDASGVVLLNPLQAPLIVDGELQAPRSGVVLDGGTVVVTSDSGAVIAINCLDAECADPKARGATINVSGTSAELDLPAGDLNTLESRDVWSDAGTVVLGAGTGMLFRGYIEAHGGSDRAAGGTLYITPEVPLLSTTNGFDGARKLLLSDTPGKLPDKLAPGKPVTLPLGVLRFGVNRLKNSGVDSLILGMDPAKGAPVTAPAVVLDDDIEINLARSIIINTEALNAIAPDGSSSVHLTAPYIAIHGYATSGKYPAADTLYPTFPGIDLTVSADAIDLGGQFSLPDFGKVSFISSGDIRFLTPANYAYFRSSEDLTNPQSVPGVMLAAGDLYFEAAQIYPATGNRFIIDAISPIATVTFRGNAASADANAPISAGGSLFVAGTNIDQGGVIRAPGGQILLGVADANDPETAALFSYAGNLRNGKPGRILLPVVSTQKLVLGDGSLTSVSLNGLVVPYGETVDGQNWRYDGTANSNSGATTTVQDLSAPPPKRISVNGNEVLLSPGAVIDISGGGDLQAQEWVAGTGGSRNVLLQYNTVYSGGRPEAAPLYPDRRPVYAIIPGFQSALAPYDPSLVAGDPLVGQAVFLSGAPGIPEGVYTLLPARYATLPGAYRLVQDTAAIDTLPGRNLTLPDGTFAIAGNFVQGTSGATRARSTTFLVQSGPVWQQYSQYTLSSADAFFGSLAEQSGGVRPRLPVDAGQLVLAATRTLGLGAELRTAAGTGGAGALVDVVSQRIQIVDANSAALAGYVQIRAADLVKLDAASLLLGGTRTRTSAGDRITALATSLILSNDDETLEAPEVLLVATAARAGDGIVIGAGSKVAAVGDIPANQSVDIEIGRLPTPASGKDPGDAGVSGDGALLRLSNGAPVKVSRINVPEVANGLLRIEAGASLKATASITLDSAASTEVAPGAIFAADAIDANSSVVSFLGSGFEGPTPEGLVITSALLEQLASAKSLRFGSRASMDFLGSVDLEIDGSLGLSAGAFRGDGGTVRLAADTISLSNDLGADALASDASGSLALLADRVVFGAGDKVFDGFAGVDVLARNGAVFEGNGSADFRAADVSLHLPALRAATGSANALFTAGALRIDAVGAGAATLSDGAGGVLGLQGATVVLDSRISSPGGSVSLAATLGDLVLGAGARIDLRGFARDFLDVQRFADGGEVRLSATGGDVVVASDAVLDVSADSSGGDAGRILVSARDGALRLDGRLLGSAADGAKGGSLVVDTRSAIDLDALLSVLETAGIDGTISLRSGSGNLIVGAGHTLRADEIRLVADGGTAPGDDDGNVIVLGTVDASGDKGGSIDLVGRSGVVLVGSLLARGDATGQRGGIVSLSTSGVASGALDPVFGHQLVDAAQSGRIVIGDAALIDVSGERAGGRIALRAPLLSDGDIRVSIGTDAQITGERELAIEAWARWSTTDASTGPLHFDGIVDPAGRFDSNGDEAPETAHSAFFQDTLRAFVSASAFPFEQRLPTRQTLVVRPGIELVNPDASRLDGDILVLSDWNMGSGSRDRTGALVLDYRHGDAAPVLTLRASGDIRVGASLSDGFFQNSNPFNTANPSNVDNSASPRATPTNPLPLLSQSLAASLAGTKEAPLLEAVDSSSFRLVAGADASSADPLALAGGASGSVLLEGHQQAVFIKKNGKEATIYAPTMVRTGTGSITVVAAGDVTLLDPFAPGVIYTAGRPVAGASVLSTPVLREGFGGLPPVLDSGRINSEAAGDLRIVAGRDILGRQQVIDDGSRTGKPGANLTQMWWPWMQTCLFGGPTECRSAGGTSISFGVFDQGILSTGGDVMLSAGRDIRDVSASLPTTWYVREEGGVQVLHTVGGGDLQIDAGRDILSGAFLVARGTGLISAGRDIRADLQSQNGIPVATYLGMQDAVIRMNAAGRVELGGVMNPSWVFRGFDSQSYSARSALEVVAQSGDISLRRGLSEFLFGSTVFLLNAYDYVLPASLELTALDGSVSVLSNGELYPSATGSLAVLARGDLRFSNGSLARSVFGMIDAPASLLPSALSPMSGASIASSFIYDGVDSPFRLHVPGGLHAQDDEPVRLYSVEGSLIDGTNGGVGAMRIDLPKAALISAGRDIVDLIFRGQHLYASDITRISAGRDYYNSSLSPARSVAFVEIGGPGTLLLQAGRNLGPITSANDALDYGYLPRGNPSYPGIRTIGDQNNAYLPRAGASILLAFGVGQGSGLEAFASTYIDPAVLHDPEDPSDALGTPDYSERLVAFVEQVEADRLRRLGEEAPVDFTPEQAWDYFRELPAYQQQLLVYPVFLDILNVTGLDYNSDGRFSQQYGRGFDAIQSLFPAALGYTPFNRDLAPGEQQQSVRTGIFDMRGSTVQTQRGGDISIIGPGGDIIVGSASAPPLVPASAVTAGIGPNAQGILALEQGAVRIFTDRSVLLAQSRIFTEQGGDILIWSSNGDVNAGKGAKTSSEIPPPEFLCDIDHFCLVDAKSQVSGAGIAVLQTRAGAASGTANLGAPRGTVDAGDAGIRVAGSLNVAAFKVANADNISVSGGSVGVPTGLVDTGALGAASSVAASVSQSAGQMGSGRQADKGNYVIAVEVLGFGSPDG